MKLRVPIALVGALTAVAGFGAPNAAAAGPPQADTAAVSAVIGPEGGSISGFGITATFAQGAVTGGDHLIVLGNWPNGLDVAPPNGVTAVKTFGLQQCALDGTNCTSPFGDYTNSPAAGSQRISGMDLQYTAYQGVKFGTPSDKKVTITINTEGSKVYIYNPNFSDTAHAYPMLLTSSSDGSTLTFQTFRPIVWTVTSTLGASS